MRSQCPHVFTTRKGSNQWQKRKTCKTCGKVVEVEWRWEWEPADSEETSSQGTMLTVASASSQAATATEAKWSAMTLAYAAHARAVARAEPARTSCQRELTPFSARAQTAKTTQRWQIMIALSTIFLVLMIVQEQLHIKLSVTIN